MILKKEKLYLFTSLLIILIGYFLTSCGKINQLIAENTPNTTPTQNQTVTENATPSNNATPTNNQTVTGNNTPTNNTSPSSNTQNNFDTLQVHFIDVGQGDSELIYTASGNYILIDANGTATKKYLQSKGITRLKYVFLTHPHSDHYSGIDDIINAGISVEKFYYTNYASTNSTYETLLALINSKSITKTAIKAGDSISIDNLTFKIYNPPSGFINTASDDNDNSLVIKVSNREGFDVLFMGDVETTAWTPNLSNYSSSIDSEILKASHHGSKNGINQTIFNAISPEATVISCGEGNSYNHPHQEALDIYKAVNIYRTDNNGDITLFVTANIYSITYKKGNLTNNNIAPVLNNNTSTPNTTPTQNAEPTQNITSTQNTQPTQNNTPTQNTNPSVNLNILIFEVLYNPTSPEDEKEWFELYNPNNTSVSLSGWYFKDNQESAEQLSGTIPANGYYVISRNNAGFYSMYNKNANIQGSFSLSNTSDYIKLYNSQNEEIDKVAWGNAILGWNLSAGDGRSIKRNNTTDTDSASDWAVINSPTPDN